MGKYHRKVYRLMRKTRGDRRLGQLSTENFQRSRPIPMMAWQSMHLNHWKCRLWARILCIPVDILQTSLANTTVQQRQQLKVPGATTLANTRWNNGSGWVTQRLLWLICHLFLWRVILEMAVIGVGWFSWIIFSSNLVSLPVWKELTWWECVRYRL